jgi:hypothetical protein
MADEEDRGVKWFGKSWGAMICREDRRQSVPVRVPCVVCQKPLTAEDSGLLMWHMNEDPTTDGYRPFHLDCFTSTMFKRMAEVPKGATCEHETMTECCEGCGHFSCSCGLTWDENAEGGPLEEETGPDKEDFE